MSELCPGCVRAVSGRHGARTAARLPPLKVLLILSWEMRGVFVRAGGGVPGVAALWSAVAMVLLP